jgi:pyruvate dehydrogenase E2 component (dihydrolipoamide acetyltransferase)
MRLAIAQNMVDSLRTMAQVTSLTEADVTELVKLREQIKTRFSLTYTDLIIKAVAIALRQHPLLNATLAGEEIVLLDEIHVGMAVALDEGLIVPVVRHADRLQLAEIAAETRRLAEAARGGTLAVDEAVGSTFTVTNLGTYGIDHSTPVINPPEVAILGVGRIIEKPAVFEGQITKRSMLGLSLTFDHRVVDGAPAAAFLKTACELLEKPYLLFV